MPIESKGRMLRRKIATSKRFASLSKDAQRLFPLIIPHLNPYGKMKGEPYFIKGECVPLLKDFTHKKIAKCLTEISDKTNLKWFQHKELRYLHALNFAKHQDLRKDRLGIDELPNYSGTSPGIRPPEVEVEDEVKDEDKDEDKLEDKVKAQFDHVWELYPKKVNRTAAFKHFKASVKTEADLEKIIAALSNYVASERVSNGYVKDGSTWFNQWQDWINYTEPKRIEHGKPSGAIRSEAGKYDGTADFSGGTGSEETKKIP